MVSTTAKVGYADEREAPEDELALRALRDTFATRASVVKNTTEVDAVDTDRRADDDGTSMRLVA